MASYDPYFPIAGVDPRVTSGIGGRASPGGIGSTNHRGIDFGAPAGSTVIAPVDLTITGAGRAGGYGNLITGVDASGYTYKFGHLSQIGVSPGERIMAGSPIGAVGSTGNSTGPHLHYEVLDRLGNVAYDRAKAVLKTTKDKLKAGAKAAIESLPGGKAVTAVTDGFGLTGECDWLCQIKNWIETSEFFQRAAIVILALILIAAAFYLFGTDKGRQLIGA